MLNKFVALLKEETSLYRSLLSLLQDEKRAVVYSNLTELNETSKEKENLLLKIRMLEEQRTRVLQRLAGSLGCSPQHITLRQVAQLVEEPFSTELEAYHSKLSSLAQSIQEINSSNKSLLMHSLELVRGSVALLNNLIPTNPVYYRTGQIQTGSQSGKVISGRA